MKLTRERILDAAVELVGEKGLHAVTFRALATRLNVSAMAPYRHFENKAALVAALLDHVIDPDALLVGTEGAAASQVLEAVFTNIYGLFLEHPSLISLTGTPSSLGMNSLRFMERLLARLAEEGFTAPRAGRAMHVLLTYTLGSVLIAAGARETDGLAAAQKRFSGMEVAEFPTLLANGQELLAFPTADAFTRGLRDLCVDLARE